MSNGSSNTAKVRYSVIDCAREVVEQMGGENIRVARHSNIVFADLTEAEANNLRNLGCIVETVEMVRTEVTPPVPVAGLPTYTPEEIAVLSGFEEIRRSISPPLYGEGFNVAIVGTGIRGTHRLVGGRVVYSKNFTTSPGGDQFNHETGVASIITAVAPKCGLLDLKVLDSRGEGTEEGVVLAIEECMDLQEQNSEYAPVAINLSLGGSDTGDPNNILRVSCREATRRRIWVIAAAGNAGPGAGSIMSPACEKYVFAIGSVKYLSDQKSFVVSSFSSRGPTLEGIIKPDCVAFGEDIEMASSVSDTATIAKSGTSFSTPFNSGLAALYHEGVLKYTAVTWPERFPGWVPEEEYLPLVAPEQLIDVWLKTFTLKPEGAPHVKDNSYGEGLVFGPLVLQSVRSVLAPAFDVTSLVGGMFMVGMMSMVMKTIMAEGVK